MMQDESKLLNEHESATEKLKKKIAVLRPPVNGAMHFVKKDEKEERTWIVACLDSDIDCF